MATPSEACVNYTKTQTWKEWLESTVYFKPPQLEAVTYATA